MRIIHRTRIGFLLSAAASLGLLILDGCSADLQIKHNVEEISFQSSKFSLVGELIRPAGDGKYGVVVFVHGDGYAVSNAGGYYAPAMERCLRAGYACFSYDKPGCGRSTGKFDESRLRQERTGILLDAVAFLRSHPAVDPKRIGLWGISQAGYVMPTAVKEAGDIAFMITVGCAAEDGIEQSAYLVGQQVKCAGYSDSVAIHMEELFAQVCKAHTYSDYARAAEQLVANPAVPKDMIAGVLPEDRWSPRDSLDEGFFDPMEIVRQITIPVLAFFGEKDTQVDPDQGRQRYEDALRRAGNPRSRVVFVSDADHSMVVSETGCVEERRQRSGAGWLNQSPEYLDLLREWLQAL